ncbi:MAG: MBOAT family protein [Vicinamibacteria bacterium]|nr:MBOAT family protein [Vicinamibacteria bacterium]
MVFSSHLFVYYFLPAALAAYYIVPRQARHLALTVCSYVFYGWANPAFVGLMLLSTTIDYACGAKLGATGPSGETAESASEARVRRGWLTLSIASNLSLLGFFKYFNFAVDSYFGVLGALGVSDGRPDAFLRVALPLGISFYTFQSMSYTIDIYRRRTKPLVSFVDFACYVSMFPQLVAGPIIRFSEISDQLNSRTHTYEQFARGVVFFSMGLAKKVLLANPCGFVADAAFGAASLHPLEAWTGALAYAFQIYFDFSGYTDMAIGLGLMLGFAFPKNFDSPYRAESITDFWRRWHMSLSTWLRDYLYLPLGGNRKGPRRTYINLAVVMLLGGLWHGAAWNFVVWGGLHGAWLAVERGLGQRSAYGFLPRPARVAFTFAGVLVTWVFFRAADLTSAVRFLSHMFGRGETRPESALLGSIMFTPYALISLIVAGAVVWTCPQTWDWSRHLTWPRGAVALSCLALALVMMASQGYNPFIYFIF